MKQLITISLEPDTVSLIDRERGLVSRSAFIEDLLKRELVR